MAIRKLPHKVGGFIYDRGLGQIFEIQEIRTHSTMNNRLLLHQLFLIGRCSTAWYVKRELIEHYPFIGDKKAAKILYGHKKDSV